MSKVVRILILATFVLGALSTSASANKLVHYCKNWGNAGLYPNDLKKVKAAPLATLDVKMSNGQVFRFPLLYIWKGASLWNQPATWKKIWGGFATACPNWPKPAWLARFEAKRRVQQDPLAAQRQARIGVLTNTIQRKNAQLSALKQRIASSPEYQAVTGGQTNWQAAAMTRSIYLRQIVSLADIRYVVIGKVARRDKTGVWVNGMSISVKPGQSPGTTTTPRPIFLMTPKSDWVRGNGNVLATGVYLQALVDSANRNLIFGSSLARPTVVKVKSAKTELKKTTALLKNGKSRLERLFRPARKLEKSIRKMRESLAKLKKRRS
jgi:hypothetical protein